jgi:hypothetical protein
MSAPNEGVGMENFEGPAIRVLIRLLGFWRSWRYRIIMNVDGII